MNKDANSLDQGRLRCTIGWLGIILPWIVVILLLAFPTSISATWYDTRTITPFMIILGSAGMLLISYRGYDLADDILNTISGIAGLAICLFPCAGPDMALDESFRLPYDIVGIIFASPSVTGVIHNISAVVFFGILSWNSLFQFTKCSVDTYPTSFWDWLKSKFATPPGVSDNKRKRNRIYRICGVGMLLSFLILLIPIRINTWLCEAVALFFFGISFITKSNRYKWLFAD